MQHPSEKYNILRKLSTVYSDYKSSFNEFLDKDGLFAIHRKKVKVYQLKCRNTYSFVPKCRGSRIKCTWGKFIKIYQNGGNGGGVFSHNN